MDLTKMIEHVELCKELPEKDFKKLCRTVLEMQLEAPNIVNVKPPVNIVGDIHGQFHDLLNIFSEEIGGTPGANNKFIFLGDYVDRGYHSLETITLLLLMKAKYPDDIVLLRGNHECRQITQIYGFYDECVRKYGNASTWKHCVELFDSLSVAALIDNSVLCVHGGLSPQIKTLEQISSLDRKKEIPHEGPLCDLMWSDPEVIDNGTWEVSPRGAGWLFGDKVTKKFCAINNIDLICRAHQIVQEGFQYHFEEKSVTTIWSAPNYCYRCENLASLLKIDQKLDREFKIFKEVDENHETAKLVMEPKPLYFL